MWAGHNVGLDVLPPISSCLCCKQAQDPPQAPSLLSIGLKGLLGDRTGVATGPGMRLLQDRAAVARGQDLGC